MAAVQVPGRLVVGRWVALIVGLAAASWALRQDDTGAAFLVLTPSSASHCWPPC